MKLHLITGYLWSNNVIILLSPATTWLVLIIYLFHRLLQKHELCLQCTSFIASCKNLTCCLQTACKYGVFVPIFCQMHVRIGYLHLIYGSYYKALPCCCCFFASLIISPMHLLVSCYKQLTIKIHANTWVYFGYINLSFSLSMYFFKTMSVLTKSDGGKSDLHAVLLLTAWASD